MCFGQGLQTGSDISPRNLVKRATVEWLPVPIEVSSGFRLRTRLSCGHYLLEIELRHRLEHDRSFRMAFAAIRLNVLPEIRFCQHLARGATRPVRIKRGGAAKCHAPLLGADAVLRDPNR